MSYRQHNEKEVAETGKNNYQEIYLDAVVYNIKYSTYWTVFCMVFISVNSFKVEQGEGGGWEVKCFPSLSCPVYAQSYIVAGFSSTRKSKNGCLI